MAESLFRCPGCKGVGYIDDDQRTGRVSIVCEYCGWHGYSTDKDDSDG